MATSTVNYATIDPNLALAAQNDPNGSSADLGTLAASYDKSNPLGAVGATTQGTQAQANAQAAASANAATDATNATNAANLQSASGQISTFLASIPGLSSLDPNGALAGWFNGQASTLAGTGMSSSDIVNTLETTMNNPGASGDAAAQQVFDTVFPGYNQKIQNGSTNSDGSYTGIAGYISYAAQIQQFSNQAGLAPGTITATDIGNLWAGDVSSAEVSQRVTDAYTIASNTPPEVQSYLAQNYGMTTGTLTSYFLNPANTMQTINSNLNSGMAGGESAATGFNQALSTSQAASIGAFLANGTSGASGSAVGTANQITAGQANQFFTGNIGTNSGTGGSIGSIAQLANGGYEGASPGGSSTGVVSEDTLIGAAEGNAGAIAQTAQAQQARTATSKGGGGATTTASGAVGLGYAQS